ncbi:pyridoxamine 5'-phosphate oxidase family protein [Pelagicoccus sp. SDUM812002]|uniref:pyridoxamine 5'-phosphate oxidase family protein n=1 Tax=Pelagicoccus sp. SDUM812002 TaxID=3041266 RepID=UPI00280DACFA|nr:pyridoxamine 5'-phosphate oxidase family protein [Pelagicoccus sp. SDUM812002]MDQ8187951.1 pyridoxamine 5'-phosphate oxidase family protein [Pelagicoccus sp. SDUM812002]
MKIHPEMSPKHIAWIEKQKMFFVGTAPLAGDGHVNLSPKGGDSFRVLGPLAVAYQDYTGSGAETIAHLRENGRMVLMFCAFEGPPQIFRLHGKGTVHLKGTAEYKKLAASFPDNPGTRAIIHLDVNRVADSCGYSVPYYDYLGNRDILDKWASKKGEEGVAAYQQEKNIKSIDGLPAIDSL